MQLRAALLPPVRVVQIQINGHVIGELTTHTSDFQRFDLSIPREFILQDEVNAISLVSSGETLDFSKRFRLDEVEFKSD